VSLASPVGTTTPASDWFVTASRIFRLWQVLGALAIWIVMATACACATRSPWMSFAEYAKHEHPTPYILRWQLADASLLYFGSDHVYDPTHPQVAHIERLWSSLRPTIAFNEGGDPPALPTVAEAVARHGESGLVRTLAARDGVEVHSLEPSHEAQVLTLRATYTAEQIKLFYALRQMEQSYRRTSDRSPAATLDHVLHGLGTIPGLAGAPQSFEEYTRACQRLLPATPDCMRPPAAWLDPADTHTGAYTNALSAALAQQRDEHMVTLLRGALRPGARVFAVVGSSHVFMQEEALRRALAATPTRL